MLINKEFVKGFSRLYSSNLETSLRLIFEFYDFDDDNFINKEDIRIILSYVPIWEMANKSKAKEGKFTSGIGAETSFLDRKQAQNEIQLLVDQIPMNDKEKIDFDTFKKYNQEVTSETLLWILNTLRNSLPCTNNFYLYLRNYQKVLDKGVRSATPIDKQKPDSVTVTPKVRGSPLASPKLGKKFFATSLLKYAVNPDPSKTEAEESSSLTPESTKPGTIAAHRRQIERSRMKLEISKINGSDLEIDYKAVRMPNQVDVLSSKMIQSLQDESKDDFLNPSKFKKLSERKEEDANMLKPSAKTPGVGDGILMSPTGFLTGKRKIKKEADWICIWGRMALKEGQESWQFCEKKDVKKEGYLLRKVKKKNKLKKEWFSLLGGELYYYRNKKDSQHKNLYVLVGVYIIKEEEELFQNELKLFPFSLVFPHKSRTFYLIKEEERDDWVRILKEVVGYADFNDYYDPGEVVGKGKFGVVKSAIHRKTGKKVAVKILKKAEMSNKDLELQKREIEILKIWQHPNIIRLLDIFENQTTLFLVMEFLSGGDMFDYLQERQFDIKESRAKEFVRKIAYALEYLHSYGIAYRDLKPENILMSSNEDDADIKLSDFGLSKIIAPNEKSDEPFGTISYAAPEVLLGENHDKSVDMWSLGVVTYLLVSGTLPFDDDDEDSIMDKAINHEPDYLSPWIAKVSKDGKDFIKSLLKKKNTKRLTLKEALNHHWLAE